MDDRGFRRLASPALRVAGLAGAGALAALTRREGGRRRRLERQLRTEHAVSRAIAEAATLDQAAPGVLGAVCEGLGWQRGNLWLVERGGDALRRTHCWSAPGAGVDAFERESARMRLAPGDGLPGRVWREGRPLSMARLPAAPAFVRAGEARDAGLRSAFAVPVRTGTEVLGVLELFAAGAGKSDAAAFDMLSAVGTALGEFVRRTESIELLAESEARKSAILESALDCIITTDARGRVLEFNPAAERTFGYSREDVVGTEVVDMIVPDDLRERHRTALDRAAAGARGRLLGRRVELRGRRADGSEFPVELAIVRVDVPGSPLFTGYLRDVTERVETRRLLAASEQQRNEVLAELMLAAEEERARIAVELHDDTIQVMTATLLSLDRLVRALEHGQHDRAGRAAHSARDALGAAVDRTRRLMFELRPPLLVEQGLDAALRDVAEQTESDSDISVEVDADVRRYPDATESLVYRTVLEAVVNVRKHAEAEHLWLRLVEREGEIHGEVRDDGRGFEPARAPDRRRRRLHLGLEAAAERCRLAGGELDVRSSAGAGTSVRFRVPILADPHRSGYSLGAAVGARAPG